MKEHAQTFDFMAAVALVDEHMDGCHAMKRFLELIAAHYPGVPAPRAVKIRSEWRLCFVPPGRPLYNVLVHFDIGDTQNDKSCFVIELSNGSGSGRARSEEDAATQLATFLRHTPTLRQKLAAVLS